MATKAFEIPGLGKVNFYKRRGCKNVRMTVNSDGVIKVTLPYWVPYKTAQRFVIQKRDWLLEHRNTGKRLLQHNQKIGKAHRLVYCSEPNSKSLRTRIVGNEIRIFYPTDLSPDSESVQSTAHKAALRALKVEGEKLLPQRLGTLAQQNGFQYQSVSVRHLKSRWGSCSSSKHITLNYYLMQLPWSLIDYVIFHELSHTKHLNHSQAFWNEVANYLPNHKGLRKQIKQYSPSILSNLEQA